MTKRQASRYRRIGLTAKDKNDLARARAIVEHVAVLAGVAGGMDEQTARRIVREWGTGKERKGQV